MSDESNGAGKVGGNTIGANLPAEFTAENLHDKKWIDKYEDLVQFKLEHGHCRVPMNYERNRQLGVWVMKQRRKYRQGKLNEQRLELLKQLNFTWSARNRKVDPHLNNDSEEIRDADDASNGDDDYDGNEGDFVTLDTPFERKWMARYDELVQFKLANGHCSVPQRARKNPKIRPLGEWVKCQRAAYKSGKLKGERLRLLNQLGFVWRKNGVKNKKGEPNANSDADDTGDRIADDDDDGGNENDNDENGENENETGFKSSTAELSVPRTHMDLHHEEGQWASMFEKLVVYRTQFGNCDVPRYYPEDPPLGVWVDRQRLKMKDMFSGKRSRLKWEHFECLESLGFKFSMRGELRLDDL